jgi:hypothetical protein
VLDAIEEPVQIDVDDPAEPVLHEPLGGADRLVSAAAGSEPEAGLREGWIEDRREHLQHGLLEQPVQHRWHSKHPHTAVGFGNRNPTHRCGPEAALIQRPTDLRPVVDQPRPQLRRGQPVHPRGTAVAFDALQRPHDVGL